MNSLVLKIIGTSVYNGTSRSGKPYSLTTLEMDYEGKRCGLNALKKM